MGSKTGAFTLLPASIEGVLEGYILAVPLDKADIDDTFEIVEETDSLDAFLLSCPDCRLAGRAEEAWEDSLRAGNLGGGAIGFAGCVTT